MIYKLLFCLFQFSTVNQQLLSEKVILCDILTNWVWFVHIPHAAITVSLWMIEVTTAIVVTKQLIVSLTIIYSKVNPYLSNNLFLHNSQSHTTFLVDF
jgi:hypothetical protein